MPQAAAAGAGGDAGRLRAGPCGARLRAADQTTIEAPTMKKTGAGFVLMVSLQRA